MCSFYMFANTLRAKYRTCRVFPAPLFQPLLLCVSTMNEHRLSLCPALVRPAGVSTCAMSSNTAALLRCTLKCSVAHYMFTRSPGDIFRETRLLRRSGEPGKIDTKVYVQPRNLSKRHPALCQGRVFRHTTLRCMSAMERMLVV